MVNLKNKHKDQACYIVGKGPSLAEIKKEMFVSSGPVITLNEAIERIESLNLSNEIYSMQKDIGLLRPKKAALVLHKGTSDQCWPEHSPRYVFRAKEDLGVTPDCFSAICALALAQHFGCRKVYLLCFDACTTGDCHSYKIDHLEFNQEVAYAYKVQCERMNDYIKQQRLNVEYI